MSPDETSRKVSSQIRSSNAVNRSISASRFDLLAHLTLKQAERDRKEDASYFLSDVLQKSSAETSKFKNHWTRWRTFEIPKDDARRNERSTKQTFASGQSTNVTSWIDFTKAKEGVAFEKESH